MGGLPARSEQFAEDDILVGRAIDADLFLNHHDVARRHCRISRGGERWLVQDLGSRSGTKVNGNLIFKPSGIKPGDEICVGPTVLAVGAHGRTAPKKEGVEVGAGVVLFKGKHASIVPLHSSITLGRGDDIELFLSDSSVSLRHAVLEANSEGVRLMDLDSATGSFVNGRRVDIHDLILGDRIQIGPFVFIYENRRLLRARGTISGRIIAAELSTKGSESSSLERAGFIAQPGQFIGILGASRSGRTALLRALSGVRPADSGSVLLDQIDFYKNQERLRSFIGYVPEDDIIHPGLTVSQALTYAAHLRLAAGISQLEVKKLVAYILSALEIGDRLDLKISQLPAEERKRVNIGVELIQRPALLFLDKPTAGFDPLADFKLIQVLRRLADMGITVVCSTHVSKNVYLMDQIAIMSDGRVVFQGLPEDAPSKFGVSGMLSLYDTLQTTHTETQAEKLKPMPPRLPAVAPMVGPRVQKEPVISESRPKSLDVFAERRRRALSLPILLRRRAAILLANVRNLIALFVQPVVIGLLVGWVTNDPPIEAFLAGVATLWFGFNNAAQEIGPELPIYRRERAVGVSRSSYIASKILWLGGITTIESLLLYVSMAASTGGVQGAAHYEVVGLILLAFSASGIGLLILAFAKSGGHAGFLILFMLLPLFLFSGFMPMVGEMSPPVRSLSQLMPTFAYQRIVDASFLLNQKITGDFIAIYRTAFWNLSDWYRSLTGERLLTGMIFTDTRPIWLGYFVLTCWIFGGCCGCYIILARKERVR